MNQINFGDQRLQIPGQFYSYPTYDLLGADPGYRPLYLGAPPPQGRQAATDTARAGQVYEAGMDDYFPGLNPPRQAANTARRRQAYTAGMDDYFPGLNPPERMPRSPNPTDWLNSGKGIAVQEGLGYGLGGLMSGGFALSAGASPGQALGIAGSSVAGDAAGSFLGHLAGTAAIPLLGPVGPFAGRMIGGMIGGIAGDRVGWKVTGAEADLNRRYQEQQMQAQYQMDGQPMYQMPPSPPTPQEKLRSEILASAQNPYMPYMMAQLGGYYA